MSDYTSKISELNSLVTGNLAGEIPLSLTLSSGTLATNKITLSQVRDLFDFDHAFETVEEGIAATVENQLFYVYVDSNKLSVNEYIRTNIGASAVIGSSGTKKTIYIPELLKHVKVQVESFAALREFKPWWEGQVVYLKGYYSGGKTGGGDFVGHLGTKDDDGGVVAAGNGFYWERILNEKTLLLEFFGAKSGNDDSSSAIKLAMLWPSKQKNGIYRISADGDFFTVKDSIGVIDFGYTIFSPSKNVTFYCPDNVTFPGPLFECIMTKRNDIESDYQGRQRIINNLAVKGDNRRNSNLKVLYLHDIWGVSINLQYHGVNTGVLFGNGVWSINFHDCTQSAQLCWSNAAATSNSGEEISVTGKSAFYNSGQIFDMSNYQYFINCFGVSFDYTPGQLNLPVIKLGNSVLCLYGCHIEYEGPSYSAFITVGGDFGSFKMFGGTLLIVVNSALHYKYFIETKKDYQFCLESTAVFGTRVIECFSSKIGSYRPSINIGSSQNTGKTFDNGGNCLVDPSFSRGTFIDKWYITGGVLTSLYSSNYLTISIENYNNASSGYALKISKLVEGAGNNCSLRLEFKGSQSEFSPYLNFKFFSSGASNDTTYINFNPVLVVGRDSTFNTPSTRRINPVSRFTQVSSFSANTVTNITLGSIESIDNSNKYSEIFMLDFALQNLPIGTYYLYDLNISQPGR